MSLQIKSYSKAHVWKIVEQNEKYSVIRLGTSDKIKGTQDYKNSTWGFVRFVGKAHTIIGKIEEGMDIAILSGKISREPYVDKDGNKQYPKNESIVVFDWEIFDWNKALAMNADQGGSSYVGMDTAPKVAVENDLDESDIPF